jgi:hypothetical protein
MIYSNAYLKNERALEAWPEIDFIDDRESCLFTATVHRKIIEGAGIGPVNADGSPKSSSKSSPKSAVIGSEKSSEKILIMLKAEPKLAAIGLPNGWKLVHGRWKSRLPNCGKNEPAFHLAEG